MYAAERHGGRRVRAVLRRMHEPMRGRLPQGPRDMPWRPGGCTTECGGLRPAERRPADMEPVEWE